MNRLAQLILALHVTLYQPLRSKGVLGVHEALADAARQNRGCKEREEKAECSGGSPCTPNQPGGTGQ